MTIIVKCLQQREKDEVPHHKMFVTMLDHEMLETTDNNRRFKVMNLKVTFL